jgi:hypothetical protein
MPGEISPQYALIRDAYKQPGLRNGTKPKNKEFLSQNVFSSVFLKKLILKLNIYRHSKSLNISVKSHA